MGKGSKRAHNRKDGKRTASGRLSRSAEATKEAERVAFEQGPTQTVLQARRRHRRPFTEPSDPDNWRERNAKPVSKAQAKELHLDRLGSVLGRLYDRGEITLEQMLAGDAYGQRYQLYASLNGIPRPTPQGPRYGEVLGSSRADRIKAAIAAKQDHNRDLLILKHCPAGTAWAIHRACVTDEAAPPHLIRAGLAALIWERG